ncbi:MAG: FecR domain-containing protein [Negativicutes bacterium]|nr:FecR domain-containing protein [Negativicutes bacterium]
MAKIYNSLKYSRNRYIFLLIVLKKISDILKAAIIKIKNMSIKKLFLVTFPAAVCAAFLLLPDYSNAQNLPPMPKPTVLEYNDDFADDHLVKEGGEMMTPREICKQIYNRKQVDRNQYTIKENTENRCLVEVLYLQNEGGYVLHEVLDHYVTSDGKKVCMEYKNEYGKITFGPKCWDYKEKFQLPSTGGWSEEADLPEPIIIKKGEPYEHDFSDELIQLLDPRDQSKPYTFSLNTMGGFPPMGLILGLDGVLKGTPVGKDSHFEACVKNSSGRKVCKVINIKLEKDKSDKPELNIIESIKSAFEPDKSTKINYQDLIYGERGQIKSKIHERIAIVMKDGSIVEMDKYSTLTPNSEYELTTGIGKFKFNYEQFPGSFCAFGSVSSKSCRQVNTPNGTIRIKGTEFTVENDSSGTNIAVIEGTVLVSDAEGKKEIEINEGQFAFLKNGILSGDPQSFEPDQLDSWWEEEGMERSDAEKDRNTIAVLGIAALVLLVVAIITKLTKLVRKKNMTEEERRAETIACTIYAAFSLIIGVSVILSILILYLTPQFLPRSVLDIIISQSFPFVGLIGLMMGIAGVEMSKKSFSFSAIALNIIGVVLWIVFVMPRY